MRPMNQLDQSMDNHVGPFKLPRDSVASSFMQVKQGHTVIVDTESLDSHIKNELRKTMLMYCFDQPEMPNVLDTSEFDLRSNFTMAL